MAAHHNINPHQLKMFMSADEIMRHYQPLDADRLGQGDWSAVTSGRAGSDAPTARTWAGHNTMRNSEGRKLYAEDRLESSDELWQRKAEEAWDYGLAQDIIDEGVKKPVSLGMERGLEGKPQVVGGHHRLAVMAEESPHELMPVLHYQSFGHAQRQSQDAIKGRGGYRYT